jgi:hypothetical protein
VGQESVHFRKDLNQQLRNQNRFQQEVVPEPGFRMMEPTVQEVVGFQTLEPEQRH